MSRVADRNDVLWMLEMIWRACGKNASAEENKDWKGIGAAAHLCLHYVGDDCPLNDCPGLDINELMRFTDRHS